MFCFLNPPHEGALTCAGGRAGEGTCRAINGRYFVDLIAFSESMAPRPSEYLHPLPPPPPSPGPDSPVPAGRVKAVATAGGARRGGEGGREGAGGAFRARASR